MFAPLVALIAIIVLYIIFKSKKAKKITDKETELSQLQVEEDAHELDEQITDRGIALEKRKEVMKNKLEENKPKQEK